jgi:serine/threonine-protein kinase
MSPEQAQGKRLDPRSDLYSLGVVLYEAIAGQVPFDSKAQVEILIAHVKEQPRALSSLRRQVPPVLAALIHELLRKNPDKRPATADLVARRLQAFSQPTSAPGRLSAKLASSETIQLAAAPATASERPTIPQRPVSSPPSQSNPPTRLTAALGPETLATIPPPRSRFGLIAAVLIALFGAGALLAWAVSRSSRSQPAIDAAVAADATAGLPDAAPRPIDAASTPDAADVIDAAAARPQISDGRKRSMAVLRELARTSSRLKRLALAQKAHLTDPSYSRARLAFADALLASGDAANKARACKLLRGFKRRRQRAGCGD